MSTADLNRSSRRRTAHGAQARQSILKAAVEIASVEGLEGLSIGNLAAQMGMSKSGLFAHFGSKEELQLAVIETAQTIFAVEVVQPALRQKPGLAQLQALVDAWLSYGERQVFRGGCFFAAATMEFDSRPGAVRDRLATLMQQWLKRLARLIQKAQQAGELDPAVEAEQLAFELHALMWGANWMFQLYQDPQAMERARTAIAHRLQSVRNSSNATEE